MIQNDDITILQDTIQRWKDKCKKLEETYEGLGGVAGKLNEAQARNERLYSELMDLHTRHELLNQRCQKTESANKELRQTIKQLQAVIDYLLNKNKGGR